MSIDLGAVLYTAHPHDLLDIILTLVTRPSTMLQAVLGVLGECQRCVHGPDLVAAARSPDQVIYMHMSNTESRLAANCIRAMHSCTEPRYAIALTGVRILNPKRRPTCGY